jgi:hypothetical protein
MANMAAFFAGYMNGSLSSEFEQGLEGISRARHGA